jgi:hypothetical protein
MWRSCPIDFVCLFACALLPLGAIAGDLMTGPSGPSMVQAMPQAPVDNTALFQVKNCLTYSKDIVDKSSGGAQPFNHMCPAGYYFYQASPNNEVISVTCCKTGG